MDPIAVAFGTALVSAMATETWQQARAAVVALWRRVRPPQQAAAMAEDLETLRRKVQAARDAGLADSQRALVGVWQGRMQELLLDEPVLAAELRRILEEHLIPMLTPAERVGIGQTTMIGSSHDDSTFNQVSGDQFNSYHDRSEHGDGTSRPRSS